MFGLIIFITQFPSLITHYSSFKIPYPFGTITQLSSLNIFHTVCEFHTCHSVHFFFFLLSPNPVKKKRKKKKKETRIRSPNPVKEEGKKENQIRRKKKKPPSVKGKRKKKKMKNATQ